MHLVFMGAHPDDETLASGTIAKYVAPGHRATIVMATRGGRGHCKMSSEELKKVRTREMKKAASILGADLVFLDYEDANVPGDDTLKDELIDVVRELKPDILLTFYPLVLRDDHRRVGLATADACFKASLPLVETRYPYHRPAPDLYFCGTPMAPLEPDVFIDVTDYMDVKIEAFRQHSSQLVKCEIDSGSDDLEDILKRYRHRFLQYGVESGVKYTEAFISKNRRKRASDFLPTER